MEHMKCLVPFQLNMMQSQAVSAPMSTAVVVEGPGGTGKSHCLLARLLFFCQQLPAGTLILVGVSTDFQVIKCRRRIEAAIKTWCHSTDSPDAYQWYMHLDSILVTCDLQGLEQHQVAHVLIDDLLAFSQSQRAYLATYLASGQGSAFLTGDSTPQAYSLVEVLETMGVDNCKLITLHQNHRTDCALLGQYHHRIGLWDLPFYSGEGVGCQQYNHYASWLVEHPQSFYHESMIGSEEMRMAALMEELGRIKKRLYYEEEQQIPTTPEARTVGILVETEWERAQVVSACGRVGIDISSGVPFDKRAAAVDAWHYFNALAHPKSLPHLYQLLETKLFQISMPKSNLYQIKNQGKKKGLLASHGEQTQYQTLITAINQGLHGFATWEELVENSYRQPLAQEFYDLYSFRQPWHTPDGDDHQYQQDCMAILAWLQGQKHQTILRLACTFKDAIAQATAQVEEGWPLAAISCMTIQQARGLEFGHVIVPFCSGKVDGGAGEDFLARKELLYCAMSRAMRSFSWITLQGVSSYTWQQLLWGGEH